MDKAADLPDTGLAMSLEMGLRDGFGFAFSYCKKRKMSEKFKSMR